MPDNFLGKKVSDRVPIIIGASGTQIIGKRSEAVEL